MTGFKNEEHRRSWQPVYQRYDAEIRVIIDEIRAAVEPLVAKRNSELDTEADHHREANLAIHAAYRVAEQPVVGPLNARIKELIAARDEELAGVDAAFGVAKQ